MRLTNYLTEGKKLEVPEHPAAAEIFIKRILEKDCKPFMKAIKGSPKFLWRGIKNSESDMMELTPRSDRKPKDTPKKLQYNG